ncbi:MAG: carboxypeptidase regulatory-like domain-containing protein [Pirellulaceae bacterium]|nr:carboxypeptidase regulatory-like domain-containing protein [Pirellulaceae bacterium]
MNSLSWKSLAVLALALVASGCGDGGPRLYKAGGTVTYKSAPVEGAQVTFTYDDGSFASGISDKDGKYMLSQLGRSVGASLGKCKVSVTKLSSASTTTMAPMTGEVKTQADADKKNADMVKAMQESMKKKAEMDAAGGPQSLIPKKYTDASTSGFAFEVTSNESANNFPLDLKDD